VRKKHLRETRTDAWHHWATRSGGEAGDDDGDGGGGGHVVDGNCTLLLHGALLYHVRVLVAVTVVI